MASTRTRALSSAVMIAFAFEDARTSLAALRRKSLTLSLYCFTTSRWLFVDLTSSFWRAASASLWACTSLNMSLRRCDTGTDRRGAARASG